MPLQSELVLGAIAAAIVALVLAGRRHIDSRALALFRVLLPSWRFFEEIAPAPRLWCRVATGGDDYGGWRELLQPPARRAGALCLNPRGNLHLACHATLEQFQNELEDAPPGTPADALIGYHLVANIVTYELRSAARTDMPLRFEFRLTDGERELVTSGPLEFGR